MFNALVLANSLRHIKFPMMGITIQMQPKTYGTVKLRLIETVTPPDSTRTKIQHGGKLGGLFQIRHLSELSFQHLQRCGEQVPDAHSAARELVFHRDTCTAHYPFPKLHSCAAEIIPYLKRRKNKVFIP